MQIRNQFEVPMPPPAAWPRLLDISFTAPCFPGAELVEKIDDDTYKGRVTVKLGPLTMVFAGTMRIENRDEAAHTATVRATWSETRGRGNASAVTRFVMHDHGGGTMVTVDSDIQLAGQIAQYGRGSGMISELSSQLVSRFAENLRAKVEAASAAPNADAHAGNSVAPSRGELSVLALFWEALVNRVRRIFT